MADYIPLGVIDLVLASLLLVLNAGLSIWLGLQLERQMAVSAVRMVVQLLLVGIILKTLFALASPWPVLLAAIVMTGFAAHEVRARQSRVLLGLWTHGIGGGAMVFIGALVTILALTVFISPEPWYNPRYAIPLFGMVLGNSMTGISIGLNTLTTGIVRERAAIEAQLLLGETKWTALRPTLREAMKAGFIPIINSMAAAGVVSLPGMMTGQILAGIDPTEAVKYQLLVMFLITGATGAGVLMAVYGTAWRLTDERDRLRLERLALR